MTGVTLTARDTALTARALDYLAAGPADARSLIAHVCQLSAMPHAVAEHMAVALFAGHHRFVREPDGRWRVAPPADTHDSHVRGVEMVYGEPLPSLTWAVVDVETTGGRAYGGDRVTEVAVVEVRDGVATTVLETLVNPERAIPPWISRLTNITWDMVKDAPAFGEICDQVLGVLDGRVFVAHNANFDWRFLSMEIERATGRVLAGRRLCTVRLARKLLPDLRRRSLDHLSNYYGVDVVGRHRAGGDAFATARVFVRMLSEARDQGCESWQDLQRLVLAPVVRRKRRRRPPARPHGSDGEATA